MLIEVEGKPSGDQRAEGSALFRATPDDARKILLDERGADWSSRQLAEKLARWQAMLEEMFVRRLGDAPVAVERLRPNLARPFGGDSA